MPKYEELKAFRKQNLIPEYNDSSSEKTMLHREARALAISRLEESARTEEEFANVISWWDKLDDNRERRERYHEIGRSEVPLEWHASDYILPGNANYDMVLWQQILAGDFIDYIFDEPDYIHELVRSQDLCLILKNMKEHQKQLFVLCDCPVILHSPIR